VFFAAIDDYAGPGDVEPSWSIGCMLLCRVWNQRPLSSGRSRAGWPLSRVDKGVGLVCVVALRPLSGTLATFGSALDTKYRHLDRPRGGGPTTQNSQRVEVVVSLALALET
jgi:hypothetical protein